MDDLQVLLSSLLAGAGAAVRPRQALLTGTAMKQCRTLGLSSISDNRRLQTRTQVRTMTFNSSGMTNSGGAISAEAISSRDGAEALWR